MTYAIDMSDPSVFKPAKFGNVATLLNLILPLITAGAALLFLLMILLAAFRIITHGDKPDEIKKSKQTITFAVLGLIIVVISFLAVQLVGRLLGIANLLPQ